MAQNAIKSISEIFAKIFKKIVYFLFEKKLSKISLLNDPQNGLNIFSVEVQNIYGGVSFNNFEDVGRGGGVELNKSKT